MLFTLLLPLISATKEKTATSAKNIHAREESNKGNKKEALMILYCHCHQIRMNETSKQASYIIKKIVESTIFSSSKSMHLQPRINCACCAKLLLLSYHHSHQKKR